MDNLRRTPPRPSRNRERQIANAGVGLAMLALLSGCATAPDPNLDPEAYADYVETNDPLEPLNRAIFDFNLFIDELLLTPLAIIYRDILPPVMTDGIDNFLANLTEPVTFVNDLLQGEATRAGHTFTRFFVNSTVGVGGLFDVATELEVPDHSEDFGQTLAVWGVGEGPYLVLPLLGPSTIRDASGRAFDSVLIDPLGFLGALVFDYPSELTAFTFGRTVVGGVSQRAQFLEPFDELQRSSLDFYAAVRSAYRQNRQFDINNGEAGESPLPQGRGRRPIVP